MRVQSITIREDINSKKNVFFQALPELPNPPPPPHPPPQFGQLGPFSPDVKQPKKQLKVQYIGIFEEIDFLFGHG